MNTKKNPEFYIFDNENFITLDPKESIGYGIPDLPEFFTWVSAYKCQKCGAIMILTGEAELVETEEREMGREYSYSDTNWVNCAQCQQEIAVDIEFGYYALGWTCDDNTSNAECIAIDGLEWLAEEYYKSERTLREKEELEGTASRLKNRLRELLKTTLKQLYVLIVEGKDDMFVWEQFLLREGVPLDCVDISVYGNGGLGEAVKLVSLFRGKKLKLIPHKLVVDSDNDLDSLTKILKERQIDPKNYHVLKEKEMESYLLEEEAVARVLSIGIRDLQRFNADLKGASGKERLERIFIHFAGRRPDAQTKGLIARALKRTPEEITSIINEIQSSLATYEEDYC